MANTSDGVATAAVDADTESSRAALPMRVDVRSASLAFIAFAACIALLRWTQEFIVPVLLGVVLSYALTPLVERLHARRVPRMAGAGLVLLVIVALLAGGGYMLRAQTISLISSLPEVAKHLRQAVASTPGEPESPLTTVQRAANELQSVAEESANPASAAGPASAARKRADTAGTPTPPTRVVVEKPGFNIRDYVLRGTLGVAAFAAQTFVVVFVALFLLASGNAFRRKMVSLAGPTLAKRRVTVQALDEVHLQIQRYLAVQAGTSVLVGILTWLSFMAIGLDNSAAWGVVAAVANLVPYIGSLATSGGAALVGFVQFNNIQTGLLLAGASFLVHIIVGNLVTPWLTGKSSRMSPFVIFVGVLFFGWLWGVAGLVLAFPIMVAVKIVCDRVEDLKPIGELLGA